MLKLSRSFLLIAAVACVCGIFSAVTQGAEPSAMPKRSVSMTIDEPHGLHLYQVAIERSQTATTAAQVLGELTEFVQTATSQDIEEARVVKDTKMGIYLVTVSIKMPPQTEKLAIAPVISGLLWISFVGNCPVNSHFEAQFKPDQLAKLTKEQKEQIQKTVMILAAFNHRLPWDTKAEIVKSKAEIGNAWIIEAVFPKAAFEKPEVSLKSKIAPVSAG